MPTGVLKDISGTSSVAMVGDGASTGSSPEQRQKVMLDVAEKNMTLVNTVLPEIELLLGELEDTVKFPALTGVPTFIRTLEKEKQNLQSLIQTITEASSSDELLNNVEKKLDPCTTALSKAALRWDILKKCHSFVAINQSFQGSSKEDRRKEISDLGASAKEKQQLHKTLKDQGKVDVDVVDGGREWIDIRPLQTDRLARQMTDSGWAWGEHELGDIVDEDEWEDVSLTKQVKRVIAAARMNRHEYEFPRVRFVMPNLDKRNEDILILLDQFYRIDPLIKVSIELRDGIFMTTPPPALELAIQNLKGDELAGLTKTVNMDHTVLVDLISDLTHLELEPQPWQASTTRAQIIEEQQHGGLMAKILYPLLKNRTLVCTREMAEHFHDMLRTVGTKTERERGHLLVPLFEETRNLPAEFIRKRFQELSIHQLPDELQIPVTILRDEDWGPTAVHRAVDEGRLPRVALDVARCGDFKSSKLSIYMYGWATGLTTVTSNKEVRGQIRTWIEANRHAEDERGPSIWRIDVTRNLLAKSATPPPGFFDGDDEAKGADIVKREDQKALNGAQAYEC
jgi:predicted RNase H-like HicB family nuclease